MCSIWPMPWTRLGTLIIITDERVCTIPTKFCSLTKNVNLFLRLLWHKNRPWNDKSNAKTANKMIKTWTKRKQTLIYLILQRILNLRSEQVYLGCKSILVAIKTLYYLKDLTKLFLSHLVKSKVAMLTSKSQSTLELWVTESSLRLVA